MLLKGGVFRGLRALSHHSIVLKVGTPLLNVGRPDLRAHAVETGKSLLAVKYVRVGSVSYTHLTLPTILLV